MKITKVSIDGDLDEFGGRALVINTNSIDVGTIKTPTRVLTSPEFQYKAALPFRPMLNNEISEKITRFYGTKWEKFNSTSEPFGREKAKLDSFAIQSAYTIKRYYPQIASETPVSIENIHRLMMLQRAGELDFISMPSLPSANSDFERIADSFTEEVISENEEPLIYLDMGLNPKIFQDRFSTLLEFVRTGQIHTIGLIYRSWIRNIDNYEYLWKNRPAEVFLQMSEVKREHHGPKMTSTMHLLQKFGIDSFSVKLVTGWSSDKNPREVSKLGYFQSIKRLDPKPIIFRSFREWLDQNEPLECNCPICAGKTPEDLIEAYGGEYESYTGETFSAANKLHEYYRSTDEFKQSREYIVDGELKDYFNNKDGLKSSDRSIQSKTIFDF